MTKAWIIYTLDDDPSYWYQDDEIKTTEDAIKEHCKINNINDTQEVKVFTLDKADTYRVEFSKTTITKLNNKKAK